MSEFTELLDAARAGDAAANARLFPLVYEELRRLAARHLSHERPGQTLDATALVHEAYLRLAGSEPPRINDRRHFYAVAGESMRRILIDAARRKRSEKHGGRLHRAPLHDAIEGPASATDDLLAIDEALTALAADDAESAELVKLRFYAGLSVEEAAEALGMSRAAGYRNWTYAKAWLRARLDASPGEAES